MAEERKREDTGVALNERFQTVVDKTKSEDEIAALKKRLQAVEEENERLKRRPPSTIDRIIKEPPPDYEKIKKDNRMLTSKIKKYRQILNIGGVSELPLLIDQYLDNSGRQLKKISAEIRMMDFDKTEIPKILSLIDHLDYSRQELSSFITLYQEGRWISDPMVHKIQLDIECIQNMLGRKSSLYAIPETKLHDFHETLVHIIEVLNEFICDGEKDDS